MDGAFFGGPSVQVRLLDDPRGLPLLSHRVYSVRCLQPSASNEASDQLTAAPPTDGVVRRYSDFRRLHESLVLRRPHRLIPELPTRGRPELPSLPGTSGSAMRQRRQRRLFLQERESGLQDYLTALWRHPVLRQDAELVHFLTHYGKNEDYAKAASQARTDAGGWDRDPIDFASSIDSMDDAQSMDDDDDGSEARIESWLTNQRTLATDRLKILVELRSCLDRHRDAAWAAAGALRGIAENLPPSTGGMEAAAAAAAVDVGRSEAGVLSTVADELSERCDAEWLASQPIDWLQMFFVGYLRLHDRLTSSAAAAASGRGISKAAALRFVRLRLRLEGGPLSFIGGWQLRQLLLQGATVQLRGNRFLEAKWRSIEDSLKESSE